LKDRQLKLIKNTPKVMKKIFTLLIGCLTISNIAFSTGGPITTAGLLTVCNGNPINVPVKVTGFNNVGGISLTLNYDAAILQFQGVILNPAISGCLTNGNNPGIFILSYICDPGINLADNATLFTLDFAYTGPPAGGTSPLTWAETPPEANEYSSPDGTPYDKEPFGNYFINGNVTVMPAGCGPVTMAPIISTCPATTISVPVTIINFNNIGGISLTLNYDAAVLQYQGVTLNPAISGSLTNGNNPGVFILSYICDPGINLADNDVLFTLEFAYTGLPAGGTFPVTWAETPPEANEYSSPEGIPYIKDPFGAYFINGSVTINPALCAPLIADFTVDNTTPPKNTTVQFTDQSTGGPTSWEWSFDRPTVVFVNSTAYSQNPQVQFTEGGLYTVTLVVHNAYFTDTKVKTGYIRAGIAGLWTGTTSSDWFSDTNWDNILVPDNSTDVVIPPAAPHWPVFIGEFIMGTQCRHLTLQGGGTCLMTIRSQ
jgi:hypothetical protein